MMYKTVGVYEEPIDIFEKLGERKSELSDEELGFICGLIRDRSPKKIVEVGVSAGGTSCVILNCLQKLNMDSEVYSIDVSYKYHCDKSKACGYQIMEAKKYLDTTKSHKLVLGKTVAEAISEGLLPSDRKIDMLILDTIHFLPGELLDFLICLPYMSEDGIVILDDLTFSQRGENTWAIATKILFDIVTADKYFYNCNQFPSLAAFQIGKNTLESRFDLFSALITPWYYCMDEQVEKAYRKIIYLNYGEWEQKVFEEALEINRLTVQKKKDREKEIKSLIAACNMCEKIFIYGAGTRGTALKKFLMDRNGGG